MEAKVAGKLQPDALAALKERMRQKAKGAAWDEWYRNTPGGKVYQYLEKAAARDGVKLSVEGMDTPNEVFKYGDETAYRMKRPQGEEGIGIYVDIRDMMRPWFREAMEATGQTLDNIHLVDMTVTEGLGGADKAKAAKFIPSNLTNAIGASPDRIDDVRKALAEEVAPIVTPTFRVEFSDGGGSMDNNYRLVPANQEVKKSCLERKDPYLAAMNKVLDSYDKILPQVRQKVLGGGQ